MLERLGRTIESVAGYPVSLLQELFRIFPDGLVMGLGFFALITLSLPYGMFFASLVLSTLFFHWIRAFDSYVNITASFGTKSSLTEKCVSGFMSKNAESLSLFGSGAGSAFPSAPIYVVSVAAAYIITSLYKFSKEMDVLGKEFSERFYIAIISLPMLITAVSLYRLFFNCDDFIVILLSIVSGLVIGGLLVEINYRSMGMASINLIGIPILSERTADGKKLYVCSETPEFKA